MHIDVSIIDEVVDVEVDTTKVDEDKIGILSGIVTDVEDVVVIKIEELTGIDEDKIVEQIVVLTKHDDEIE